MVNRHIDIMRVGNRSPGFDMISRRCAEAYEVYFSGNMLCQGSRCDSIKAFQDGDLCSYAGRTKGANGQRRFAAMPDPITSGQESVSAALVGTYVTQLSLLERESSAFRAHMARTE